MFTLSTTHILCKSEIEDISKLDIIIIWSLHLLQPQKTQDHDEVKAFRSINCRTTRRKRESLRYQICTFHIQIK